MDLKPSELIHYGGVEWLNMHDYLGKIKKGLELNAMVFVFKKAVIFLCKERVRQKKKQVSHDTISSTPLLAFHLTWQLFIAYYQRLYRVKIMQVTRSF